MHGISAPALLFYDANGNLRLVHPPGRDIDELNCTAYLFFILAIESGSFLSEIDGSFLGHYGISLEVGTASVQILALVSARARRFLSASARTAQQSALLRSALCTFHLTIDDFI
jgi:hypothetical protein